MSKVSRLKPLSAFEWASVSQYIVYISSVAGLKEFNASDVVTFPLAKIGPKKLIGRKERVLALLKDNREKVESFAKEYEKELEGGELSVLRTLYIQLDRNIITVEEHLRVARYYQDALGTELTLGTDGGDNDLLF